MATSPGSPISPASEGTLLDILLNRSVGIDHTVVDLAERYTLGRVLGEGRFSQVRSATRQDGEKCALKGIALEALEEDEETLEVLEAEVTALRLIRSQHDIRSHVVQLHEVLEVAGDTIYLVLGLVSGSELFEMIERHGPIPQTITRVLISQLLNVLMVLHESLCLVHRDIKPENRARIIRTQHAHTLPHRAVCLYQSRQSCLPYYPQRSSCPPYILRARRAHRDRRPHHPAPAAGSHGLRPREC